MSIFGCVVGWLEWTCYEFAGSILSMVNFQTYVYLIFYNSARWSLWKDLDPYSGLTQVLKEKLSRRKRLKAVDLWARNLVLSRHLHPLVISKLLEILDCTFSLRIRKTTVSYVMLRHKTQVGHVGVEQTLQTPE